MLITMIKKKIHHSAEGGDTAMNKGDSINRNINLPLFYCALAACSQRYLVKCYKTGAKKKIFAFLARNLQLGKYILFLAGKQDSLIPRQTTTTTTTTTTTPTTLWNKEEGRK